MAREFSQQEIRNALSDLLHQVAAQDNLAQRDEAACWTVVTRDEVYGMISVAGPFQEADAKAYAIEHSASVNKARDPDGGWEVRVVPMIPPRRRERRDGQAETDS